MPNNLTNEIDKFFTLTSAADHYRIFFRLIQLISTISTIYLLFVFMPTLRFYATGAVTEPFNPFWLAGPIAIQIGQMALAEFARRAIARHAFSGTAIGLVMASMMMPSWCFLLGLYGFYAFLNGEFQRRHLRQSPEAFRQILTALNLNQIDAKTA